MRISNLLAVVTVGLSLMQGGCEHIDDTANRARDGACDPTKYPCGPYGYAQNSIIENISFLGKQDPAGANGGASYATLPMQTFGLDTYYQNPAVKYVFMSGAAVWCGPCNGEQPSVKLASLDYEARGVRFLEALIDTATPESPATETDINNWATKHHLHVGIALDPQDKI